MQESDPVGLKLAARPLGAYQFAVFALCGAVVFCEGFDVQAIAYVAPAISKEWHLAKGALGPVFAAALTGMMLGSMLIAPLADRFGRRTIILAATVAFGLLTLATPMATDLNGLMALRFLTGLGLGGAFPNVIALTAEFSPAPRRSLIIMLVFSGFAIGSALGAALAAAILETAGWRPIFYIGGVAPLALAVLLVAVLPESPYALARRGATAALDKVARRLRIELDPAEFATPGAAPRRSFAETAVQLFADGRGPVTLVLWLMFFMSLLDMYLIVNWLPTVFAAGGVTLKEAAGAGAVFQMGGLFGGFLVAFAVDRFGATRVLPFAYLIASLSVLVIALTPAGSVVALAAVAGAGMGVIGGQNGANALASLVYPASCRATGVGWALGVGRIGSIVGPLVGGLALSLDLPPREFFLLGAIPVLVASTAAGVVHVMRRRAVAA